MSTQARDAKSMDAFITLCPFCCARSSTYTLIRSAWPILCTTSYVCLSVRPPVRLSVRLYQLGTAHLARFTTKHYTLTTVMMIKTVGTCATSGRR